MPIKVLDNVTSHLRASRPELKLRFGEFPSSPCSWLIGKRGVRAPASRVAVQTKTWNKEILIHSETHCRDRLSQ